MKYLFIGLKELFNNKLIHIDIKFNNIVLDKNYFKYIDFGLSGELKDMDHFENRSLSEFNTKRISEIHSQIRRYGSGGENLCCSCVPGACESHGPAATCLCRFPR